MSSLYLGVVVLGGLLVAVCIGLVCLLNRTNNMQQPRTPKFAEKDIMEILRKLNSGELNLDKGSAEGESNNTLHLR